MATFLIGLVVGLVVGAVAAVVAIALLRAHYERTGGPHDPGEYV